MKKIPEYLMSSPSDLMIVFGKIKFLIIFWNVGLKNGYICIKINN